MVSGSRTFNADDKKSLPQSFFGPDAAPETEFRPGVPRGDVGYLGNAETLVSGRKATVSLTTFTLLVNKEGSADHLRDANTSHIGIVLRATCDGLMTYDEVVKKNPHL